MCRLPGDGLHGFEAKGNVVNKAAVFDIQMQ